MNLHLIVSEDCRSASNGETEYPLSPEAQKLFKPGWELIEGDDFELVAGIIYPSRAYTIHPLPADKGDEGVKRKIGIDEVHDLVRRYNKKEISISKMTELINDKNETP